MILLFLPGAYCPSHHDIIGAQRGNLMMPLSRHCSISLCFCLLGGFFAAGYILLLLLLLLVVVSRNRSSSSSSSSSSSGSSSSSSSRRAHPGRLPGRDSVTCANNPVSRLLRVQSRGIKIPVFLRGLCNAQTACHVRPQSRHACFHHCAQCFALFGAHCVFTDCCGWPEFMI